MDNLTAKQGLTTQEMQLLSTEMNNHMKNSLIAWLLWFFVSGLGGHKFYLGKPGQAIGYIALNLLGWVTVWIFIGFLFWGAMFIWWIIDAIKMNDDIQKLNERKEREIIERILRARER